MSHQHIDIDMQFNCEPDALFRRLTDHEEFGRIVNANIKRVVDSHTSEPNGLGSVRRISLAPGIAFEETVQSYQPFSLMEYQVSRGSPIKEHWGRLQFTPSDAGCRLFYTIDFKGKIPGTGWLIRPFIEKPIRRGLAALQSSLRQAV